MYIGGIWTFWAQKFKQEILAIFTKIMICNKSLCIIFYTKVSRFPHYTYCLQEELTHCALKVLWQFDIENHKRKTGNILRNVLNHTNIS